MIRPQASNSPHGASGHRRGEPSAALSARPTATSVCSGQLFSERAPARICRYINTVHRPLLFRISLQEPPAAPFSGVPLPGALSGQGRFHAPRARACRSITRVRAGTILRRPLYYPIEELHTVLWPLGARFAAWRPRAHYVSITRDIGSYWLPLTCMQNTKVRHLLLVIYRQ